MWRADFWLGLVPQPFHKHLAANGVKPHCPPVSATQTGKAQQHPRGVTALNTPQRLQLDTLEKGILLWRDLQECKAADLMLLLSCSSFFIVPNADHPVQIQAEIPAPGTWPLLLKQFAMNLGDFPNAQCPAWPLSLLPPTSLPLAEREDKEKKAMDLQLPACPKMESIVKDITKGVCSSTV